MKQLYNSIKICFYEVYSMLREVKDSLIRIFAGTLAACGIGVAMILISPSLLAWLAFVLLGVCVIAFSLPEFIHQIRYFGEEPFYEFLLTCFVMAFGFALIFWHEAIVMIVIGALMLLIPCLKILCSNAKTAMLRTQLPVIALGVALLVIGPARFLDTLFDVGGYLIIALAVIYCLYSLIFRLPRQKSAAIRSEKKNIGDE